MLVENKIAFDFLKRKDFARFQQEKPFQGIQDEVREIAIYKGGGGLGDLIVGINFFKQFKKHFPKAKINYLGVIYPRFEKIFKAIPYIDGYIHFERPNKGKGLNNYFKFKKQMRGRIDLLVDTQRRWETSFWLRMLGAKFMLSASPFLSDWNMPVLNYKKMHIVEQMFTLPARLGMQDFTEDWQSSLNIPQENRKNAEKFAPAGAKIAVLMPSSGMVFKNWMPEYFAKLGDLFANSGYMTIILGSPKDKEIFENISNAMNHKPVIPVLEDESFAQEILNDAAILEKAKVAVGNDSGGMHLASALGVLCATVFGPTTPRKFSPIGPKNIVFYQNLACSPCRFKCVRKIQRECLASVKPEDVFSQCALRLKER